MYKSGWFGQVFAVVSAVAVLALAPIAKAATDESPPGDPIRLVIGLDLSKSNPLVDDEGYAAKSGEAVEEAVRALPYKSKLALRTFGSYSGSINSLRTDRTVSALNKPDDLAVFVGTIVAGIPKLVREGKIRSQNNTNIIAFLENMAQTADCADLDTRVILISDGIEDSDYVDMKRAGAKLPRPTSKIFEGCSELRILGLGQGQRSPAETARLREEWAAWAEAAGFETFTGLNDW